MSRKSSDWRELLAGDPNNELVLFSLAKALFDEKSYAEARDGFLKLTQSYPEYALAWAYLARAEMAVGNREGAREACERGMPIALKQKHETPQMEIQAVLDDLDSEF